MTCIAVIGTGAMGSNHIRVLASLESAPRIVVVEVDDAKRGSIAARYGIGAAYKDLADMLANEKPDGIIIATPSSTHKSVLLQCLDKCKAILCEKPLAHSMDDVEAIIKAVKKSKTKVLVGHIERFNPAVAKMQELIKDIGKPYLFQTRRNGPYPKRLIGTKQGVLIDLAVHDVDIVEHLIGHISSVFAQLLFEKEQEIYANVMLELENAVKGSCEFSWVSPRRIRSIEIYGTKGILSVDYQNQEVWFYENAEGAELTPLSPDYFKGLQFGGKVSEGKVIKYPIRNQEPLSRELSHFLDIVTKNIQPQVTVEDGARAVEVALAILNSGTKKILVKM